MGPQFFVDGGFVCTYKGITRLLGRGSVRITPAHAGKRRSTGIAHSDTGDHPRTRGEKPIVTGDIDVLEGSPPRVRGKETAYRFYIWPDGITPAHAGKS